MKIKQNILDNAIRNTNNKNGSYILRPIRPEKLFKFKFALKLLACTAEKEVPYVIYLTKK